MTIEEFLSQHPNIKKACEQIRGKAISDRTWYNWSNLVGAVQIQGKKLSKRHYTDEQTQLFFCLAWMRRLFPGREITYSNLRQFWQGNEYKVEEVLDQCCNEEPAPAPVPVGIVELAKAKMCCDRIAGREISRNTWVKWRSHLKIDLKAKLIEEGKASLLVYIACWRQDHPNEVLPSMSRLTVMMRNSWNPQMTIERASSQRMRHQWAMQGCLGKELHLYLTAQGFRVAPSTLYKWGKFSQRKHYSVSELAEWRKVASQRRCG